MVAMFSWLQPKKKSVPTDPADPLVGKTLGDYRLLRRLGKAGLCWVYEAQPGAHVRLLAEPGRDQLRRLHREIQMHRALDCEGIPRLLDYGEDYLVCEAIPGRPLQPTLAWPEAARLGRDVARTLQCIHELGYVSYRLDLEHIWSDGTRTWLMSLAHARRLEQAGLMSMDKPVDPAQDQLDLGLVLSALGDHAGQPVLARMLQADPAARFPDLEAVARALS